MSEYGEPIVKALVASVERHRILNAIQRYLLMPLPWQEKLKENPDWGHYVDFHFEDFSPNWTDAFYSLDMEPANMDRILSLKKTPLDQGTDYSFLKSRHHHYYQSVLDLKTGTKVKENNQTITHSREITIGRMSCFIGDCKNTLDPDTDEAAPELGERQNICFTDKDTGKVLVCGEYCKTSEEALQSAKVFRNKMISGLQNTLDNPLLRRF